ncbi:MAG: hypothetical protein JNK05_02245 [Myxococcales bacterium]|nr:hypothetical protein [Myxococcales bacterium]
MQRSPESIFAPCPSCSRHVRVSESQCPFCDRKQPERRVTVVRIESGSRALMLAMTAAVACDQGTASVRAATNAPPDARSVNGDTDVTVASAPDAAAPDTGVVVAFDWSGLGATGWGAAYGSSPLDPRTLGVGERPTSEAELVDLQPPDRAALASLEVHANVVRWCERRTRNRALDAGPAVLTVRMSVSRTGHVRSMGVTGPGTSRAYESCLRRWFQDLVFSRGEREIVASYRVTRAR